MFSLSRERFPNFLGTLQTIHWVVPHAQGGSLPPLTIWQQFASLAFRFAYGGSNYTRGKLRMFLRETRFAHVESRLQRVGSRALTIVHPQFCVQHPHVPANRFPANAQRLGDLLIGIALTHQR